MARTSKKISGAEFIKNLSEMGEPPVIVTGMVKLSNEDNNSLLFARPGNCSHWVPIPADMIDHVETLGAVGCQGHAHHLVQVHLKRPESPEAQTFASLAQLHAAMQPPAMLTAGGVDWPTDCPYGVERNPDTGRWQCRKTPVRSW